MPTPEATPETTRRDFVKLSSAALAVAATQSARSYAGTRSSAPTTASASASSAAATA